MRTLALASLLAAALALLAACGGNDESVAPTATPATNAAATPTLAPTATSSPQPTATATSAPNVCAPNPDPAPASLAQINTPQAGNSVTSPMAVTGLIAAYETTFQVRVFDANQQLLADQTAMSQEGQTLATFSASVAFSVQQPTPACVWVFEFSPKDGMPSHVTQVPVTLLP